MDNFVDKYSSFYAYFKQREIHKYQLLSRVRTSLLLNLKSAFPLIQDMVNILNFVYENTKEGNIVINEVTNKFTIFTQNISKELQLDIQKYNKQYTNLEVKITKNFHDRFLICDETVYHFGASFKDLGNKIFAVNRMNILVNDLLKNI